MKSLEQWLGFATWLDGVYLAELGRSCYSDPQAFVNWCWHWAGGQSEAWIVERIRESSEWQALHGGGGSAPLPVTPLPPFDGQPRVIKVADASEGPFHPRFYSYWSNAWVRDDGRVFVFAGSQQGHGPRLFSVDPATGRSHYEGAIMHAYLGTTEGWSWDREGWIHHVEGARLLRSNPFTAEDNVVFDISGEHPRCRLWQSHSEGGTHCATIERITTSGPYERIGTVVYRDGVQRFFPATGLLDESMISGDWLVIKETRNRSGRAWLDNRVINLATGADYWINDEDGALGHSDGEGGIIVGEDDQQGACVVWDNIGGPPRILFRTWNMGHVSVRGGRCLLSDDHQLALVALDGSGVTPILSHGVNVTDYDSQVRANLDPTGRAACYMAHGSIFVVRL